MSEQVIGVCPMGCGSTLFLGSGGYVTCSWEGCPDPGAASDLLAGGLNFFSAESHKANMQWWVDADGQPITREKGTLLMLMVSELAEAMEGERKDLMDDKLPHRKQAEVELADCLIRVFDYAGAYGYNLQGAYREKTKYNAVRADHKIEVRALASGKQF